MASSSGTSSTCGTPSVVCRSRNSTAASRGEGAGGSRSSSPRAHLELVGATVLDDRQGLGVGQHPPVGPDADRLVGEVGEPTSEVAGSRGLASARGSDQDRGGTRPRVGQPGCVEHHQPALLPGDGPDGRARGQLLHQLRRIGRREPAALISGSHDLRVVVEQQVQRARRRVQHVRGKPDAPRPRRLHQGSELLGA